MFKGQKDKSVVDKPVTSLLFRQLEHFKLFSSRRSQLISFSPWAQNPLGFLISSEWAECKCAVAARGLMR